MTNNPTHVAARPHVKRTKKMGIEMVEKAFNALKGKFIIEIY